MSQLMKSLFFALGTGRQEGEAQAVRAADSAIQAVEQRLTYQEFENLWDSIMNIGRANDLDSFTLGFRLGVQLTLEGLKPIE